MYYTTTGKGWSNNEFHEWLRDLNVQTTSGRASWYNQYDWTREIKYIISSNGQPLLMRYDGDCIDASRYAEPINLRYTESINRNVKDFIPTLNEKEQAKKEDDETDDKELIDFLNGFHVS